MTSCFYRLNTDQTREPVRLEHSFAGATPSACWLIGGGPSLSVLPCQAIRESPIPKMGINLAGTRLMRTTFWTSYDPSVRFHRSVYLDPGIMKFVHHRRASDLVPETTVKVCDCPNLYFFERDGARGFADFLCLDNQGIVDWADSMVQAIDILYRLGFRVLYLAGCELRVRPSPEQIERAAGLGVRFDPHGRLTEFLRDCCAAGVSDDELDALPSGPHYHFDEHKPIRAAANTDEHYFRISQYLRLSRRSMSLAGLQLISVTPHSRLNDYFPYRPARSALREIERTVGNPCREPVHGLYSQTETRSSRLLGPMKDFRPHNWTPEGRPGRRKTSNDNIPSPPQQDGEFLVEAEGVVRAVPNGAVGVREEG